MYIFCLLKIQFLLKIHLKEAAGHGVYITILGSSTE